MDSTERDFTQALNGIKEALHKEMTDLAERYQNMKNWNVEFKFDWAVENISWIDADSNDFTIEEDLQSD